VNASPLRKALPSLVSLASMLLALASMVQSARGDFVWAGWLIVWCTLLDKADGTVARALHAGSPFGVEMDSFCDFTAFGIAPGALVWYLGTGAGQPVAWIAVAAAACPMAAAIRLARFNTVGFEDPDFFTGVPTTFAAGVFASLHLSLVDLGLTAWEPRVLPSVLLAFAVLMVGGLRVPKLKKRSCRAFNVFQVAGALACVGLSVARVLPEVLFVLTFAYLLVAPIVGRRFDPGRAPAAA
jgi:CDP-diacylglycerol--serine O-phosphatidyltransferase